jgi:hypothetical protein
MAMKHNRPRILKCFQAIINTGFHHHVDQVDVLMTSTRFSSTGEGHHLSARAVTSKQNGWLTVVFKSH